MHTWQVGGSIRDELMGLTPKDFDYLVTGATHDEMIARGFKKVGADFPVYLHPETGDEYALARTERKTGKGYLGFEVDTSTEVTVADDLSRRDFTLGAMARNLETGELVDPFNGQEDLKNKVLRHVSPAFSEDPLRVIRLARFYARYSDFTVAPETMILARDMCYRHELDQLSTERFWAELTKVFEEKQPQRFFSLLRELDADLHVHFFNSVYGLFMLTSFDKLKAVAAAVTELPADMRVPIHVALCGSKEASEYLDNRTRELHSNVQFLRELTLQVLNAHSLYELLKRIKAFSNGSQVDDLYATIGIANQVHEKFCLKPEQLLQLVKVARKVTAADFDLPQGKELGAAIERSRKAAIAEAFNLRD